MIQAIFYLQRPRSILRYEVELFVLFFYHIYVTRYCHNMLTSCLLFQPRKSVPAQRRHALLEARRAAHGALAFIARQHFVHTLRGA